MILSQNLRKGNVFLYNGEPWSVLDYSHMKKARGSAVVRVKIKNLKTGVIKNETFNSSEKFEEANLKNINMQYLYGDENNLVFMDPESYEQKSFSSKVHEERRKLLKEGETYQLQLFEDSLVNIIFPKSLDFKVEYTEPGFKGDTSSSTLKPAKLENNIEVQVPLFINIDDIIRINTDDMSYIERVKKS